MVGRRGKLRYCVGAPEVLRRWDRVYTSARFAIFQRVALVPTSEKNSTANHGGPLAHFLGLHCLYKESRLIASILTSPTTTPITAVVTAFEVFGLAVI
jgi:hypothetical protein